MKFFIPTLSLLLTSTDAFTTGSFSGFKNRFAEYSNSIANRYPLKTRLEYAASTSIYQDTCDPYVILNLAPGVDLKEIKKAYRKMALKYHPDAIRGLETSEEEKQHANDTFAKINAAYAFLTGKSDTMPSAGATDNHNVSQNRRETRHQQERQSNSNPWNHQNMGNNDAYRRVKVNYGDDIFQRARASRTSSSSNHDPTYDEARSNHYYQRSRMNNSYYANGWHGTTVQDQYVQQGRTAPSPSNNHGGVGARNVQMYDCNGKPTDGIRSSHDHLYTNSKFVSNTNSQNARTASRVYSSETGRTTRTASARNVQQYDCNGNVIDPSNTSSFKTTSNTWRSTPPVNNSGFQDIATKFRVRDYDMNGNPIDQTRDRSRTYSSQTFTPTPKRDTSTVKLPRNDRITDDYARTSKPSSGVNLRTEVSERLSEPLSIDNDFARAVEAMENRMKKYRSATGSTVSGKIYEKNAFSNEIQSETKTESQMKNPEDMSIRELKAAVRSAGLENDAIGFMEKSEFIKLLKDRVSTGRPSTRNPKECNKEPSKTKVHSEKVTAKSESDKSCNAENVHDPQPIRKSFSTDILTPKPFTPVAEQVTSKVITELSEPFSSHSHKSDEVIEHKKASSVTTDHVEMKVNTFASKAKVSNIYDSRKKISTSNDLPEVTIPDFHRISNTEKKTPLSKIKAKTPVRTWLSAAEQIQRARSSVEPNKKGSNKKAPVKSQVTELSNFETALDASKEDYPNETQSKLSDVQITKFDICDLAKQFTLQKSDPKEESKIEQDMTNQLISNGAAVDHVIEAEMKESISKVKAVKYVEGSEIKTSIDSESNDGNDFQKRRNARLESVTQSMRNSQEKVKELKQKTVAHRKENERRLDLELAQEKAKELREKKSYNSKSFETVVGLQIKQNRETVTFEKAIGMKSDDTRAAAAQKKRSSKILFQTKTQGGVLTKFRRTKSYLALKVMAEFFLNIPGLKIACHTYRLGSKYIFSKSSISEKGLY